LRPVGQLLIPGARIEDARAQGRRRCSADQLRGGARGIRALTERAGGKNL
jgi:hypothetical protein